MKRKVQFGEETRFAVPIRRAIRTGAQWLPDLRLSRRALALAERSRLITRRFD